jgi:hypothetical protein
VIHEDALRVDRILKRIVEDDLRSKDYQLFADVLLALNCYQLYLSQRAWGNQLSYGSATGKLNNELEVTWAILSKEGGESYWLLHERFWYNYDQALALRTTLHEESYTHNFHILPLVLYEYLKEKGK